MQKVRIDVGFNPRTQKKKHREQHFIKPHECTASVSLNGHHGSGAMFDITLYTAPQETTAQ